MDEVSRHGHDPSDSSPPTPISAVQRARAGEGCDTAVGDAPIRPVRDYTEDLC
jgi:hypothetical protein